MRSGRIFLKIRHSTNGEATQPTYMKKSDLFILLLFVLLFLPFLVFPEIYHAYYRFNANHGYLMSFAEFAILSTFGDILGLRIKTGSYIQKGFGYIPRALLWGFIGICIKMGFVIFGNGAPEMLASFGIHFPTAVPAAVLLESGFSWIKLLAAFSVGITINIFYAPVFMAFYKIIELHIKENDGTLRGFFTPVKFGKHFTEMDWHSYWHFILKKTLPFFWIPAQTLNFMFPEEFRILVAASFSIILGILLSVAGKKKDQTKIP